MGYIEQVEYEPQSRTCRLHPIRTRICQRYSHSHKDHKVSPAGGHEWELS